MVFADIHIHVLFGVDDGAKTESDMYEIIHRAYESGTRVICCTSHFHPGYFGNNMEKIEKAFGILTEYAGREFPDLRLYLGNELRYSADCVSWLKDGECHTINGTRNVLVDFSENASERVITDGLNRLQNAGYRPVLAHVERYRQLHGKMNILYDYLNNGIVFQSDAQALFRGFGFFTQLQCRRLLDQHMIAVISSDAHDCKRRPPEMNLCYEYLVKKYGSSYARKLCYENAMELLNGKL